MNGIIKDIVRYVRIILLRLRSMIIRPLNANNNSVLIIAPHPDDEVFGCAGLIQQVIECGKTVNVVIMSGGGKSHSRCCDVDEVVLIDARRNLSRNATKILGLPLEHLHFLNYPDDSISIENNETVRLAELVRVLKPDAVFIPHSGEGWSDHIETRNIALQLLVGMTDVKIYEYSVWFWYYNTWYIDWKRARLLKMNERRHRVKLKAIDAYIVPKAPCGKPWSGVLPPVFLKANSWNKELYFEVK